MNSFFKWLAITLFTLFTLFSSYLQATPSVSVVFVLDESGSVSYSNFNLETSGFQEALNALPVDGSVEVSVIGFSSSSNIIVDKVELTATSLSSVTNALTNNPKNGGGTNMSSAIASSTNILLGSTAPTKVICLATDGSPNSQSSTTSAANDAKNSGVSLTPVGIGLDTYGKGFLDGIASLPPIANPTNFSDFATVVTNICVGVTKSALNLALTPASVDFGITQGNTQSECSQQESIELNNRSTQIASITNISIQGEDAGDFQLQTALGQPFDSITFPSNIPGSYNTNLEVKLAPNSTPDDNTYDATIVVSAIDENGISGDFSASLHAPLGNACLKFSAWDAQLVIGSIDDDGTPYAKSGNILTDSNGKFTEVQITSVPRTGLVTDGNARLMLTTTTSIIDGTIRFEILSSSIDKTEARLGTLTKSSNKEGSTFVDVAIAVNDNGEGQANAILRAGERFLGTSTEKETSFSVRSCLLNEQNECTSVEQTKVVREKRAPVVLIHGLWADAKSFKSKGEHTGLFNTLSENGLRNVGTVEYENYLGPTAIMPINSRLISTKINKLCLLENYSERFACTRVDLIGHSMGGLVARKFIKDNKYYRSVKNFQQGSVRRLITLGTPHLGSGLASLLMRDDSHIRSCIRDERLLVEDKGLFTPLVNNEGDVEATVIRELQANEKMTEAEEDAGYEVLENGDYYVNGIIDYIPEQVDTSTSGAINYLALGSDGLDTLNENRQIIPSIGLLGNIGGNLLFSGYKGRYLDKFLKDTGCITNDLFLGEDSDGVVALSSAQGNLGTHTEEVASVAHMGMGTNEAVIDWVISIIDAPLSTYSTSVMNISWPTLRIMDKDDNHPLLIAKTQKLSGAQLFSQLGKLIRHSALAMIGINTAYAQDIDTLQISVSSLTPNAGEQIIISLDSPSDGLESISLQGDGVDIIDDTSPYSWAITIPNEATGSFQFYVAALSDIDGLTSNIVEITVTPETSLTRSILFEPTDRIVLYPGSSEQLTVIGQGTDGFNRDLSASLLGTTYSENIVSGLTVTAGNSDVFSIDSEGKLTAQAPGEAEIVAHYGTLTAIRRILVVAAESDDADGDGISDTQEDALGTNKFSQDSDGNGIDDDIEVGSNSDSPLDSDGDGIIDALEFDTRVVEDENGQHISIKSSAGTVTSAYIQPLSALPERSDELALITMPLEAFGFTVEELTEGQAIDVALTYESLPSGIDSYLKYGQNLPQGDQVGWYAFTDFDVQGNTITLHLTDNALGDDNSTIGIISDPGGPGASPVAPPVTDPPVVEPPVAESSSNGGGCSYIPNSKTGVDPTLALSLLFSILYLLRRKIFERKQ